MWFFATAESPLALGAKFKRATMCNDVAQDVLRVDSFHRGRRDERGDVGGGAFKKPDGVGEFVKDRRVRAARPQFRKQVAHRFSRLGEWSYFLDGVVGEKHGEFLTEVTVAVILTTRLCLLFLLGRMVDKLIEALHEEIEPSRKIGIGHGDLLFATVEKTVNDRVEFFA
jgi:hypothetical protein